MKIRFRRTSNEPVVARTPGTFYSVHAANPDVLPFRDEYLFIFRGQDELGHDEIGIARCPRNSLDGRTWSLPDEAAIRVAENPRHFDSGHILDPAAVPLGNQLFVYFTAHRSDWSSWNIPSYIGLARSSDAIAFKKYPRPLIEGMAPEIVPHGRGLHLLFQRMNSDRRMSIYHCPSEDGFHFSESDVTVAMRPLANGGWDSRSLSTARVVREGSHWFMFYGGCRRWPDYPEAIGLARSKDLKTWERYRANPIFERGEAESWDEGALWFATVERISGRYHMWYEGVGSDQSLSGDERRRASDACRNQDYGGYATTAFSQIGHAVFDGALESGW